MSKINYILKNNIKRIIGITLGITITYVIGVGASSLIEANEVLYDNTTSKLISTNVQSAIDELNTKANEYILGSPIYYAYGQYKGWCSSTDTGCNTATDFPVTSTIPPEGHNVYATKFADGQYGICVNRGESEYCFRGRNWIIEKERIQELFSNATCDISSTDVYCYDSDSDCYANSSGGVGCGDYKNNEDCNLSWMGFINCEEMP